MFQQTKQHNLSFLVPLDGSHLAESVLPAVEHLASRCQARVKLLHIMEQHAPTTIHGERHLTDAASAQTYLEEMAVRLQSASLLMAQPLTNRRSLQLSRLHAPSAQRYTCCW